MLELHNVNSGFIFSDFLLLSESRFAILSLYLAILSGRNRFPKDSHQGCRASKSTIKHYKK